MRRTEIEGHRSRRYFRRISKFFIFWNFFDGVVGIQKSSKELNLGIKGVICLLAILMIPGSGIIIPDTPILSG